jgi:hypothetical protein
MATSEEKKVSDTFILAEVSVSGFRVYSKRERYAQGTIIECTSNTTKQMRSLADTTSSRAPILQSVLSKPG